MIGLTWERNVAVVGKRLNTSAVKTFVWEAMVICAHFPLLSLLFRFLKAASSESSRLFSRKES